MGLPQRIRLLDIDVAGPLDDIAGLHGYAAARALVRMRRTPVAIVDVALHDGVARAVDLRRAIDAALDGTLPAAETPSIERSSAELPPLTVAVCTRDRTDDLAGCLDALRALDYPDVDILVVDNAPRDDATAALCRSLPGVRHVTEPRPGLDFARNRALLETAREIIAFTDDDARPDVDWARRLVAPFLEDPHIAAAAGLVVPLELETPAQIRFETYGGLSGGLRPIRFRAGADWGARGLWHCMLVAQHGSGANMAFRRSAFDVVGAFDPALDVGTPTHGGGDTEMFFRILAHGFGMAYEPGAVVRHRHRRDDAGLRRQVAGWGSGMSAVFARTMLARPGEAWVIGLFGARGLLLQGLRLVRPGSVSRRLALRELRGYLEGPWRYLLARRRARAAEARLGAQDVPRTSR